MKCLNQFNIELQKIAAAGIVGDILAGGLFAQTAATAAHHIKGFKEALKAGATFAEARKHYNPLPIGEQWGFKKLTPTKRSLKIDLSKINEPIKGALREAAYERNLKSQRDIATNIGMPFGAVASVVIDKKLKDKNKNVK